MSKLRKVSQRINDNFSDQLDAAFEKEFETKLNTTFNIIELRKVSRRADGRVLTKEQRDWIAGYSQGYADAMDQVTLKEDGTKE